MKKLVRDKIIAAMKKNGQEPNFLVAKNDEEFYFFLKEKLNEELEEFFTAENSGEEISEMGDVLEVLNAICKFKKLNWKEIEKQKEIKKEERGAFEGRIILLK